MKRIGKLLALLLALVMLVSLTCSAFAVEADTSMQGKVVILHSNDVHGALEGYAKIAQLKEDYAAKGAEVILADAGDFVQGTPYVSVSQGATAVEMMNAAGYDVATLGNHEFDFGYENLTTILKDAKFQLLCADVTKDGESILPGTAIVEKGGVKIGFFGLETPETYTKVNPALIQGLSFTQGEALYACAQAQIDALKADGADVIVCLSHLGVDAESEPNRSVDVYANTKGIDIMLDGHSHTVMTKGDKDEPIQSTGTKFANIGVVVIDAKTKAIESHELVAADGVKDDAAVLAKAQEIEKKIDEEYGAVFAKSEVDLNGDKAPGNRTEETNLGDLITDAMRWSVLKEGGLKVDDDHVVAITNGGGIRASIAKGDISMKDVNTVLPFGNTVAVIYVTGAELLEALEASTYCTPTAIGGFPQTAGLKFTVNGDYNYDQGEQYPDSTYYAPKTITRVTIDEVNGEDFDAEATYAVVTNNFCAAGGDTYYVFKNASEQFDTSIPLDEALMDYITNELKGVVDASYAEPEGRITVNAPLTEQVNLVLSLIESKAAYTEESYAKFEEAVKAFNDAKTPEEKAKVVDPVAEAALALVFKSNTFSDKPSGWAVPAIDYVQATGLMKGTNEAKNTFEPLLNMTRSMVVTVLYRMVGEPSVEGLECPFTDLTQDWYRNAVIWAYNTGVTNGTSSTTFGPDEPVIREQMAKFIVTFTLWSADLELADLNEEETAAVAKELADVYTDAGSVSEWAKRYVLLCNQVGLMKGNGKGAFDPLSTLSREQCAQILLNMYEQGLSILEQPADETPAEDTTGENTPAEDTAAEDTAAEDTVKDDTTAKTEAVLNRAA